ncbi:MAG: hypothetical protein ABJA94_00015 [Rhodoglobus sp.]
MTVVNFRTDEQSQRALDELTADGTPVSTAIRQALLDSVVLRKRDQMRRESTEIVDDPVEAAESRAILADMDELRAW